MKKILALLLSLVMLLALAACGGEPEQTEAATTAPKGTTEASTATPETEPGTTPETTGTATATEPVSTEPAPTESAPTEPASNEPGSTETVPTEPDPEEDPEEQPASLSFNGSYFKKSGAPTLGTADGKTYTNSSIGLSITLGGDYRFASEAAMLETNEVAKAEELAGKDFIYITADILETVIVRAYKLGSAVAGNTTDPESAFLNLVKKEAAAKETGGATVTLAARTETFSAGGARAVLVTVTQGYEITNYLYIGYPVGEYLVVVMINDFYGDDLDTTLKGFKIS